MHAAPAFELKRATSVAEAAAWLAAPGTRILAGGTDLVPNLRRGLEEPATLVDIGGIAALRTIAYDAPLRQIGAGVTLARLAADPRVAAEYPALAQAAAEVAAPAHRNAGTVGGNLCLDTRCVFYNQSAWWRRSNAFCLKRDGDTCHVAPQGARCHAAFSGDLAPALLALQAEVETVGPSGREAKPLENLYRDDGANCLTLGRGEIVTAVRIPARELRSGYAKARRRGAIDFPLAGVAIALALGAGRITHLRAALTGTNSCPLLLETGAGFVGEAADLAAEMRLGKRVEKQVKPLRTTIGAADYRRQVAVVLARRLFARLTQECP